MIQSAVMQDQALEDRRTLQRLGAVIGAFILGTAVLAVVFG